MTKRRLAGLALVLAFAAHGVHAAPEDDAPLAAGPSVIAPPDPEAVAPPPGSALAPRQRANALRLEGKALEKAGDKALARTKYEAAMAICEVEMRGEPACVGTTAILLGDLAAAENRDTDAREHFRHAIVATEQTFGPSAPQLAMLHFKLGKARARLGDRLGAAASYEAALALVGKAPGPKHPFAAEALIGVAQAYAGTRRWPDMREPLDRALPVCPGHVNGVAVCEGRVHHLLGVYYKRMLRPEDAEREWNLSFDAFGRAKVVREQVTAANSISLTYRETGALDRAEASVRRGIALETAKTPPWIFGPAYAELARVLDAGGRKAEAETAALEAIRRSTNDGDPKPNDLKDAEKALAEIRTTRRVASDAPAR